MEIDYDRMAHSYLKIETRQLLEPPNPIIDELKMFTCTYEVQLSNIKSSVEEMITELHPAGAIKALNCNYGHKVADGCEKFIKKSKAANKGDKKLQPAMVRQRKHQGDGSCFNSQIEGTIVLKPEDVTDPRMKEILINNPTKIYAIKCFPSNGITQLPGVIDQDLYDGKYIAQIWADYLNKSGISKDKIEVVSGHPNMLNYKSFIPQKSSRLIVNLGKLKRHLVKVKLGRCRDKSPFPIHAIKYSRDDVRLSLKFLVQGDLGKSVRINVYYGGKINILGANDKQHAVAIYEFFKVLLTNYWYDIISIIPLTDAEKEKRLEYYREVARDNPIKKIEVHISPDNIITDDELASIIDGIYHPHDEPTTEHADNDRLIIADQYGLSDILELASQLVGNYDE